VSHKRDKQQTMFELFGDPQHSVTDQVLRAYEDRDKWVNRMVLGDSLAVMNSLLHYEGLGVFDPVTMEVQHRKGDDVPAWFLDTDYNGLCFHVSQAFFPRTGAWDSLKKALKGEYEESVWDYWLAQ
jgi:hypothetical protein